MAVQKDAGAERRKPPTAELVDRLMGSDEGFERTAVLQALLKSAGDGDAALEILRSSAVASSTDGAAAEVNEPNQTNEPNRPEARGTEFTVRVGTLHTRFIITYPQ